MNRQIKKTCPVVKMTSNKKGLSFSTTGIIPYFLILIILIGLFSPGIADARDGFGQAQNFTECMEDWANKPNPKPTQAEATTDCNIRFNSTVAPAADQTEFQKIISDRTCGLGWVTLSGSVKGCIVQILYIIFYTIPAYLLWAAAQFFNVLIAITLGSELLSGSAFISAGWKVARDLSNIFFILILLYIAVKIILGLGGSDVKKMISMVIIMALLINFSMFMTKVVIDSSNILALIFYNKLTVSTVSKDGSGRTVPINDTPILASTFGVEKNVAGALTAAFDPTSLLTANFFKKAGEQCSGIPGSPCVEGDPSVPILIGIMIIAGALMFFAAYAFFVAGISFVGRLIELWVLIIFSPFAFMSSTVPLLARTEYIGWDSWLKRLFKVSFMAPIFMFFMYFIFLLLQEGNPFGKVIQNNGETINTILLVFIPAVVILVLLLKATEFAKKGGGKLGEFASTTGKIIGGLTVGAATGGAALAARGTIGRAGTAVAESGLMKKWEARGFGGGYARSAAKAVGGGSFDIRGAKIGGQTLASATGIPMGEAQKGGFTQARKEKVEKRQKRAKDLEVGEDEKVKQNLNKAEADLQGLLGDNAEMLRKYDEAIKAKRQELDDAHKSGNAGRIAAASSEVEFYKKKKKDLRISTGIYNLEENIIPKAKQDIADQNRKRKRIYANKLTRYGFLSGRANREAAHKVRMDAKIEEKK